MRKTSGAGHGTARFVEHFLQIDGRDFIFGAERILVMHVAGDVVHQVLGEMEGGIDDAGLNFVRHAGFQGHFATGGEDADVIAGFDAFLGGVVGMDGEHVAIDDLTVAGAAGHGAAIVMLQQPAGG